MAQALATRRARVSNRLAETIQWMQSLRATARRFVQLPVHFKPVAFLAVWLQRGSKSEAINGAFDRGHAPRGELRTRVLG